MIPRQRNNASVPKAEKVTVRNLVKNLNVFFKNRGDLGVSTGGMGDPEGFLCGRPIAAEGGDLLSLMVLVLSKRV